MNARPILAWPGGKRRLAKHILPLFDNPHRCYVEPFAGGAALLFMRSEPAPVEVINDIHSELVCLYRCVRWHLDELVRQFRWALASREMFEWAKIERPETLTDIQRAARFLYLQKLAFGAKVTGHTFGTSATQPPRLNLLRLEEDLSAAHLRLARVTIEHLPWQDCMQRYDRKDTLFFCDPPYWQTTGYGPDFDIDQYRHLAGIMAKAKGRVILTINDHPDMRRIFGKFLVRRLRTTYTIGGKHAKAGELLITSGF
ncbi:MAG TPA: DNA adenine methylase [Oleiagrimonas sp.]|nr:DNA adenine methylase [Oleiagrimonas sp.]